jgi:hypothetical protein
MRVEVMLITPEIAQKWLRRNTKNRKISMAKVKEYTAAIKKGGWILNGDTICFSDKGVLTNGQHRLLGVVASNTPIESVVVYGVEDPEAFKTYDQGLKRTTPQLAVMMGIKNPVIASAVARRLAWFDGVEDWSVINETTTPWNALSGDEVLRYLDENDAEIQQMVEEMRGYNVYKFCRAGAALIAALILCNRTDDVSMLFFLEGIKTGANLNISSPIYLLREKLICPPPRVTGRWEMEVMALTIKAWNRHLAGKPLKFLRWRQEGDKPEYFPIPGVK